MVKGLGFRVSGEHRGYQVERREEEEDTCSVERREEEDTCSVEKREEEEDICSVERREEEEDTCSLLGGVERKEALEERDRTRREVLLV